MKRLKVQNEYCVNDYMVRIHAMFVYITNKIVYQNQSQILILFTSRVFRIFDKYLFWDDCFY